MTSPTSLADRDCLAELGSLAASFGVALYADATRRWRVEAHSAGTVTVACGVTDGVSLRSSTPRGVVEVAVPCSWRLGADLVPVRTRGARMSTMEPGWYVYSGHLPVGPNGDARVSRALDDGDEVEALAARLSSAVTRPPTGMNLRLVVDRLEQSVAVVPAGREPAGKYRDWWRLGCFVTDATGRELSRSSRVAPAADGATLADGLSPAGVAEVVERACAQADRAVAAEPTPTGEFPVVFAPVAAGTIAHELIGHLLESDNAALRPGGLATNVGTEAAADCLSVSHDGTDRFPWTGAPFDDEGVLYGRTPLIDEGVIAGHLRCTRRAGHDVPALPRMSTIVVAPGNDDDLTDVPVGLLVRRINRGAMDPRSGRCVIKIAEAAVIGAGRIGPATQGGTVVCDIGAALRRVDAVGREAEFSPSICSKAGQHLPAGAWSPALRIAGLTVR